MATVIARETMSKAGMENRPGSRRSERRRRLARPIFGAAGTDITDELPSKHHNTERPRRPQRLRLRTRFLVSVLVSFVTFPYCGFSAFFGRPHQDEASTEGASPWAERNSVASSASDTGI